MGRTVEIAPCGPRAPIRLRRVPPCEPPFDDELEADAWPGAHGPAGARSRTIAHQLALDWSPAALARLSAQPDASLVSPPTPPPPVVVGASADAKLAVRRFVRACVEVLNGYRPAAHLRQLAAPREAAAVVAQGLAGAQRVAESRQASRPPGRRTPRRVAPVAVISLKLCEPRVGAVEAAVALVTGERTWAMALRLESHDGCWSATTLQLI